MEKGDILNEACPPLNKSEIFKNENDPRNNKRAYNAIEFNYDDLSQLKDGNHIEKEDGKDKEDESKPYEVPESLNIPHGMKLVNRYDGM